MEVLDNRSLIMKQEGHVGKLYSWNCVIDVGKGEHTADIQDPKRYEAAEWTAGNHVCPGCGMSQIGGF